MRPPLRIALALAGLALILLGLWIALISLLYFAMSLKRPDPTVPDGDPCCGHPDTWGDVAYGTGYGIAIGYVALAVVAAGTVVAATGVNGRVPGAVARRARGLTIAGVLAVTVAAAILLHWFVL